MLQCGFYSIILSVSSLSSYVSVLLVLYWLPNLAMLGENSSPIYLRHYGRECHDWPNSLRPIGRKSLSLVFHLRPALSEPAQACTLSFGNIGRAEPGQSASCGHFKPLIRCLRPDLQHTATKFIPGCALRPLFAGLFIDELQVILERERESCRPPCMNGVPVGSSFLADDSKLCQMASNMP